MLPLFFLPTSFAAAPTTPSGCEPSTLHHCVGWIGRAVQSSPSRAWRDAMNVAGALPTAGRVFSPSELAQFYAAAAVAGLRLKESYAVGAQRRPEDPSEAELSERTVAWAGARCRIAPDAPLPVWITESERGALETLCEPAALVNVTAPRLVWIDGRATDAGGNTRIAPGEHVLQHVEGGTVVTTMWQVPAEAPSIPLAPLTAPAKRRPATLSVIGIVSGALLAGGGVAALVASNEQQTELQELQAAYLRGERDDLDNAAYTTEQETLAAGVSGFRVVGITGVGVGVGVLGVTAVAPLFQARAEF